MFSPAFVRRVLKPATTHAVLIAGAVLFMIPIAWMLGTSMKTPMETTEENLRFLPHTPRPASVSPYLDDRHYLVPDGLGGVPPVVWQRAEPLIETLIRTRLEAWVPVTPGPPDQPAPHVAERDVLLAEMEKGLLDLLDRRMGDDLRNAASASMVARGFSRNDPPDEIAIADAADALALGATEIMTDEALADVFARMYRRFSVGEVRVRTDGFIATALYTGEEWSLLQGDADLVGRHDGVGRAQEVRYRMPRPGDEVRLLFVPRAVTVDDVSAIDRIFVSHRGDESWARTRFVVERNGTRYATRRTNPLYTRDWVEVELRFPGDEGDLLEQRHYRMLRPVGPAEHGEDFAVEMHVERVNALQAWSGKTLRAYREAFRQVPFARFLATSFSLAILNIVLAIFSCTLVGYAFARLQWPGRDLFFVLVLATMMLPPQVTMIPQFIIMKELGWYNTLVPLWILSAFGIPFFIFLVRQFAKNIPVDLEDAARVDGCGFLRIYWHVLLPLIRPVIVTIAIFTFMMTWNNFIMPLIYLNDERLFPVALGLFKFNLSVGQDVSLMMAGAFIASLPSIALFAFLQRYFIEGVTLSGTKG